jgi:DNA polymerase III epsilon subunit-like protein
MVVGLHGSFGRFLSDPTLAGWERVSSADKMSNMERLVALDLETGGLDPSEHSIIEIAAYHPESGETIQRLVRNETYHVTDQAMDVHGYKIRDLASANYVGIVDEEVKNWLDETVDGNAIAVGMNVYFDLACLGEHMPQTASRFSHRTLDVTSLQFFRDCCRGQRLGASASYFKNHVFEDEYTHSALDDAKVAWKVVEALISDVDKEVFPS